MPFADLGLTEDGDLPPEWTGSLITGLELIRQRIQTRLRLFLGEWILDQTQGMPFVEWVQRKPAPLIEILSKVAEEVITVPGVVRFESPAVSFNAATRAVNVSGVVVTEADGQVGTSIQLLGGGANRSPAVIFFAASGSVAFGGGGM